MASTPDYPRLRDDLRNAVAGDVRTPDEPGYADTVSGSNLTQRHRAPIAVAARSTDGRSRPRRTDPVGGRPAAPEPAGAP